MPSKLTYTIIFGFISGVLLETYLDIDESLLLWVFLGAVCLSVIGLINYRFGRSALLVSVFLISFVLGVVRMVQSEEVVVDTLSEFVGEEIEIEGTVASEVERREKNQRFVLEVEGSDPRILVSTELYPSFYYGDIVTVSGTLKEPSSFTTDQGKEFDYAGYLYKDNIYYTMSFVDVVKTGHEPKSRFHETLFRFKGSVISNIEDVVPPPESTFLSGISLGARSGIPEELRNKFITTGTIHIVALSGYNISVVAKGIQQFFSYFFSHYLSLSFGAFSIVLFVLMTGAQATAVRAGIMALLVVLAKATGRTYEISRALFIAGFLMVLVNPSILVFDVSFQLSFIATLGIIHFTPVFERWMGKKETEPMPKKLLAKSKLFIRDIIATTLSAQVAVLPFIIYKMGTLSVVSFPINILILPFIPVTMYLGFFIGIFGFLGSWVVFPFGYVAYKLLSFVLWLIDKGSSLKNASISVQTFPLWLCASIYLVLILFLYIKEKNKAP